LTAGGDRARAPLAPREASMDRLRRCDKSDTEATGDDCGRGSDRKSRHAVKRPYAYVV